MSLFFQFEADFVDSLRCIPMIVRFKLDTCGIKLKLVMWNQFSLDERQLLIDLPCDRNQEISEYKNYLLKRIESHSGSEGIELPIDANPAWLNSTEIPGNLLAKLAAADHQLSLKQWQELTPLQRFALIKLSGSTHESINFLRALQEFNLI